MDKRTPEVERTNHKTQGAFMGHITLQGQQGPGAPPVSGASRGPHILDPCFIIKSRILSLSLKQGSRSGMRGLKISHLVGYVCYLGDFIKNLHFLLLMETEAQATPGL